MTITTPSLLFPAISLMMLAYTNRFVSLTKVIRELGRIAEGDDGELIRRQIRSLRLRVHLIRWMQTLAVLAFALCTLSMIALFGNQAGLGTWIFGSALALFMASLLVSLYEVHISTRAINLEIERLDTHSAA